MQDDSLRLVGFLTDKNLIGPKRLAIKLTNQCNYACFYCGYHSKFIKDKKPRKKFNIDFDIFKNIVDDAKALRVDEIVLLGSGEPFLHPCIYGMIEYVKQKGLRVMMLSNGTFDKKKVRVISQVNYFVISFNSFREDVFRKTQCGTLKHHQTVLENLKILSELKRIQGFPDTRLLCLVHRMNVNEMYDMVHWAKQYFFDSIEFRLPFVQPEMKGFVLDDAGMHKLGLILKNLIDQGDPFLEKTNIRFLYEKFSREGIDYQKKFGSEIVYYKQEFEKDFQCPAGWYYATIDINGNVYPCCHYREDFSGGNIYQASFKEIWLGKKFSQARKRMKHEFDISKPFWQRCHNCCITRDLTGIFQRSKKFAKEETL